jgi:hypothetical protein
MPEVDPRDRTDGRTQAPFPTREVGPDLRPDPPTCSIEISDLCCLPSRPAIR